MNEETKDTRMLPVQCDCAWNPDRHADSCPVNLRDRLTDAQAMLAEKDARIAQLAAHARGKNKALANALKEIERLEKECARWRSSAQTNWNEFADGMKSQLQAAPAERGVDDIRPAAARAYGFLWHVNNEPGTPSPMYSADKAAYRARIALRDQLTSEERGKAIHAVGIELGRYDPATADSDVLEVK